MISQEKITTISNLCDNPDGCFPQEIYDLITDEVALPGKNGGDRSSLMACSLVSQSFLPRCRRHIFHSLEIHPHYRKQCSANTSEFVDFPTICANVLKHFQSAPHLSAFVRTLDLKIWGVDLDEEDPVAYKHLPAILESFPNIQTFKMQFSGFLWASWQHLGLPLQTHLLDFLSLRQLTSIYLNNVQHFPITALTSLSNLSNLYLSRVTLVDQSCQGYNIGTAVLTTPIKLLSLASISTRSLLMFITMMQGLKLENLNFDAQVEEDVHLVSSILSCSEDSLNTLRIDVRSLQGDPSISSFDNFLKPMSFKNLTYLRHLTLDVLDKAHQDIFSLLESIPRTNQLESLILNVNVRSGKDSLMGTVGAAGIWSELDHLLSLSTYSPLHTFTLRVFPPGSGYEEWKATTDIEQCIRTKFPLLQQSTSKAFNLVIE